MKIENKLAQLQSNLEINLKLDLPKHHISEVYEHAVLPPGKLFRPQLVMAIAEDFSKTKTANYDVSSNHSLLASAIECHHSYTLVHDDLPCMDNDIERRGKPSTHYKYGQWKALLAGDGLLNLSYSLLSKIESTSLNKVLRFFSWSCGPKGLIQGQVLDLSEEMRDNFKTLIETHKLKTARLIQNSIVSSYFLIDDKIETNEYRTFIDLYKIGHYTGVVFQLLDDLTELTDDALNEHECSIGPWFNFPTESYKELIKGLELINSISQKYEMESYDNVMKVYFSKIHKMLTDNRANVLRHLNDKNVTSVELEPIILLLQRRC